jgi:hypothetical protein
MVSCKVRKISYAELRRGGVEFHRDGKFIYLYLNAISILTFLKNKYNEKERWLN